MVNDMYFDNGIRYVLGKWLTVLTQVMVNDMYLGNGKLNVLR